MDKETHPKGLGVDEESMGTAAVSDSGVRKNLAQMGAKLGPVASNSEFLYDSAPSQPAGLDEAEREPNSNYSGDEHGESEE